MDKGHTLSAWLPHSYENIYFLQERYESVVMSGQMVDQIRAIPPLIHKGYLRISTGGAPERPPTRSPHATMLPARAGIAVMRQLCLLCVCRLLARRGCRVEGRVAPRLNHPRRRAPIHAAAGGREAPSAHMLWDLQRATHAEASRWTICLPAATIPA